MLGTPEIIVLLLLIIGLIFGPKKIPELAQSLGQAKQEYTSAKKEAQDLTDEE